MFFHKYLPEAVGRFVHEVPTAAQPERGKKDPANHAAPTSGAMTRVDMQELVSALKALRLHQKARRKLDLLIRKGDRKGKLVLELSGRSKFAGFLTTINCVGSWKTETLVPAASFRGFVAHPPVDETPNLSFHDGRLHIGAWSCPARVAEVD